MSTPGTDQRRKELRVYGHSSLFYWWPVWVLGYVLGIWTWIGGDRMVIVPSDSEYRHAVTVQAEGVEGPRNVVMLPEGETFPEEVENQSKAKERVHPDKNLGVLFALGILAVILITNVPLRGLWSAVLIILGLLLVVTFAYFEVWAGFLELFGRLSIHINMGFYFFFSTVLLIAWLLVVFVFDRFSYWRFSPGQVTHEFVIGGGERSYNTDGMAMEKLRDDMFRHIFLGLGSGDVRMRTRSGADEEVLNIPNVLFVSRKLLRAQELVAARPD